MITHEILPLRAKIFSQLRSFFASRNILEVETPILSAAGATAPHLASFTTHYTGPHAPHGQTLYLQTSPEFHMKRLLAAGSGSIYQICKAFRNGEEGGVHNPEFTMVEWYSVGIDLHALMDEVEGLVREVLADSGVHSERLSYAEAFLRYADIDIHNASLADLRECARQRDIAEVLGREEDRDAWLDLLLTHRVTPNLGRGGLCFVYDYPATQAALARIGHSAQGQKVALRFELFMKGVELASGYQELQDSEEQRKRFQEDRRKRLALDLPDIPVDEHLLSALPRLPACAGVALGVDRLIMLALGAKRLEEVLSFPITRA